MSTSSPPTSVASKDADDVAALRDQVENLQSRLAHVTMLLRTTQESCMVWEQTFNAVCDPVAVISSDYRVLRANAAYRRLLEDTPTMPAAPELPICFDRAAGPCEHCPLAEAMLARHPGHVRYVQEVPLPSGPGEARGRTETRTFERWIYPIVNTDGTVDRVVEIIKDVTEEVRLQQAMSTAEALRQADQFKAELLGTVSHELRSPLAAIQGFAETLLRHEKRLPTAERHEFLAAIQQAGTRLSTIVDRMLELSELDTGSYPLRRSPVDLVRTARDALTAVRMPNDGDSRKEVAFVLRLEDRRGQATRGLPLVLGDERLLRDLLDHLLENAVKYSPSGGAITVTLRPITVPAGAGSPARAGAMSDAALNTSGVAASTEDASIEMLELTIEDQGIGIPVDHLPRIFERFHQVDSGLTREAGGMGLGLAICQRIAELHDGAIWVESTPGDGSTFHVRLPLAPASD